MKQYFRITGSARILPAKCVTAEELDRRSGLPLGWTVKHTGVRFRYEAVEPENGTTLGRQVVLDALNSAGLKLAEMELLVDASLSLQQPIPSNSALMQEALGLGAAGCATMDIH